MCQWRDVGMMSPSDECERWASACWPLCTGHVACDPVFQWLDCHGDTFVEVGESLVSAGSMSV